MSLEVGTSPGAGQSQREPSQEFGNKYSGQAVLTEEEKHGRIRSFREQGQRRLGDSEVIPRMVSHRTKYFYNPVTRARDDSRETPVGQCTGDIGTTGEQGTGHDCVWSPRVMHRQTILVYFQSVGSGTTKCKGRST